MCWRDGAHAAILGSVTTPDPPPFALDGTVSRDKLLELLAVPAELPELDFKAECDLNDHGALMEITKDLGAMMIRGGYLVVGASDSGQVLGLPAGQERLFDEAVLVPKVTRYLAPGFQIRAAVQRVPNVAGGVPVALVWAAPHSDGCCLLIANGEYDAGGKTKFAFRAGQVYARHGTRSVPAVPADLAVAVAGVVSREKDAWRAEHAEQTERTIRAAVSGLSVAMGPADSFTWQLDADRFDTSTVELMRRDDDIPIQRMLRAATRDVRRLTLAGGGSAVSDLVVVLDRITTVAALGLEHRRPQTTKMAVQALLAAYDTSVREQHMQSPGRLPAQLVWLRVAERLYALGGLAVRLRDWPTVRELVLAPVPALDTPPARAWPWHRHALTQASRAALFTEALPDGGSQQLSLLLFARAAAAALPALHPDLSEAPAPGMGGPDPLLGSIRQFDLLVAVVSGVAAGARDGRNLFEVSYPNYARTDGTLANPAASLLVLDAAARQALIPHATDFELARVLDLADNNAQPESRGFWGWERYTDPRVQAFIAQHDPDSRPTR